MSDSRVGEVLASKYRLQELLGSGGMGDVYRAVNEHVGRSVAIKVLRPEHAQNSQIVERFLREARAANLVRHPNVVDVLDIGEDCGAPFIVQELLDGEDLAHFARRRGGKLPLEEVCELLLPVIDAVAEAHLHGVVHRDIKPENVFLAKTKGSAEPVPKLLDFGISKVRASGVRATEVGMMLGTPAYMAPEQVQGARDADPRSDVWALGVMMFELISGRLPFEAEEAFALFIAIATKDAPALLDIDRHVPPAISRVVERCLRRKPDDRYPTAAEFGRDLRHVMENTELEPTGRRSLAPRLGSFVPELEIPPAPAPVVVSPPSSPRLPASAAGASAPVDPRAKTALGYATPEPPSLAPPPARPPPASDRSQAAAAPGLPPPLPAGASSSRLQRAAAPAPAPPPPTGAPSSRAQPAATPASARGIPQASDVLQTEPLTTEIRPARNAPNDALSGIGLAPGPSSVRRPSAQAGWGPDPAEPRRAAVDMRPIIGMGVVGLVVILAIGVLMQVAHRPEGWGIAHFVFGPAREIALGVHGVLGVIAILVGASYCRRAVRVWRGDLAGGIPSALFGAALASGAFFCAIEIFSAVF